MRAGIAVGRALTVFVVLGGVMAACATQAVPIKRDMGMGPALSVESFLQAANAQDLDSMARLFGTSDGPIGDTGGAFGCMFKKMGSWISLGDRCSNYQEIELRMNAIAMMLRHDDYQLGNDQRVAGRTSPTTEIPVSLTRGNERFAGVPFTVVRSGSGSWLIEEIGLEAVTGNSGSR
jgi:hypothetical protein